MSDAEAAPLLPTSTPEIAAPPRKRTISTAVILLVLLAGCLYVGIRGEDHAPKDDLGKANYYLARSPVIDGHIDLPELARTMYSNDIHAFDLNKKTIGHFDIPRARAGHLGGFFWSVFTECPSPALPPFLTPFNAVRDTLEQIDVSKLLIEKYDAFQFCETSGCVREAIRYGRIGSLLGVEGGHQFGNSLAVVRQLFALGVRYATLTHSCNNAFADSAGIFEQVEPVHGGLSDFGKDLIYEMNRLGMLVDISHVSDATASQAIDLSLAPVIWSHSASRHFNNISRNVPDWIVQKIGKHSHGKKDGVVMINIYPSFMSPTPETAGVEMVADHVEWIAGLVGREHVGIGSDFDGIEKTPKGMEDVSKYPALFAELLSRKSSKWTQKDLANLAGENVLRVLEGAEATARKMKKEGKGASMGRYKERTDLGRGMGDF